LLGRKRSKLDPPRSLSDRLEDLGARRIAVLGLHPRSGTRTVVQRLCAERRAAGRPIGILSAPRALLPDEMVHEPESRIRVSSGTVFARVAPPDAEDAAVEVLGMEEGDPLGGAVWFCRAVAECEVAPTLHRNVDALARIASRMTVRAGGPVLVDGGWSDREFAAPGWSEAWILSAGAGFSDGIERIASAVRYRVDCMRTPETDPDTASAWRRVDGEESYRILPVAGSPIEARDPAGVVRALGRARSARVLVPRRLGDDLLAPLARHRLPCRLVLGDATRLNVSPVYLKSWQKAGGRLEVAQAGRVLAVTTNPVNVSGPDVDAVALRDRVRTALEDAVPVHDVMLEMPVRKRRWRFWG